MSRMSLKTCMRKPESAKGTEESRALVGEEVLDFKAYRSSSRF